MRVRLTLLLTMCFYSTGVLAQAGPETWSCHAPGDDEVLVVAAHQGGDAGTISVAGTEQSTHYEVEGFDRRWSFGPSTRDAASRYVFRLQPDGVAFYFDLARGERSQQVYRCEQQGEATESARRLEDVQRERAAALDTPPQVLVAEAAPDPARAAELRDQYTRMIESHVTRFWDRPLSARPGLECIVNVVQLPSGDVVSAKIAQCNGDAAVRGSIENAVMKASPLPRPPSQATFSRNLTITFAPDE